MGVVLQGWFQTTKKEDGVCGLTQTSPADTPGATAGVTVCRESASKVRVDQLLRPMSTSTWRGCRNSLSTPIQRSNRRWAVKQSHDLVNPSPKK